MSEIEKKRREIFEVWARRRGLDLEYRNIPNIGQFYECPRTILAQDAFNAALDAVEIELPCKYGGDHGGCIHDAEIYDSAIDECAAAIKSTGLGLKVK